MMKKIHCVILLLLPVLAHGQEKQAPSLTWKHVYGGKKSEVAHDVISTFKGEIVVVGETTSPPARKTDGLMLLLDPTKGDTVFQKLYGGEGDDVIEAAVQTYDGNYVLAGHTTSFGQGKTDAWLLKVNREGDTLWQKTIGSKGDDRFRDIIQTSDGYLVAVGSTSAGDREGTWVYKMYSDGDLVWEQTFGYRASDEATAIVEGKDGNYGIVGNTSSGKGGSNIWLFILSKEGKPQYHQLFGSRQFEEVFGVTATSDGGYALAGYTKVNTEGLKDMWVIKTAGDAEEIWEIKNGGKSNDDARDIVEMIDGSLIVAGFTFSHLIGANTPEARLIKLSGSDGKLLWEQNYGDSGSDELHSLVLMPDGSLVLAGQTNSKKEEANGQDMWVIHLDPEYVPTTTKRTNVVIKDFQVKGIKNNVLTENDDAYLLFTLENIGKQDAHDIYLDLTDKSELEDIEFPTFVRAGYLGAGQSKKINLPLRAKKVTKVETARLEVNYSDVSRSSGKSDEITVTVQPAEIPPNFLQVEWVDPNLEDFPGGKKEVKLEKVSIKVLARSDKPMKKSDFTVYVNGVEYSAGQGQKSGEAGLHAKNNQQDASGMYLYTYSKLITFRQGINEIEVEVKRGDKTARTGKFKIEYNDLPNLHVIALGVKHEDLLFTTKDAQDFAASFQNQDGRVFDKVYMRTLISGATTKAGIFQTNGEIIKEAFSDLKEKYNYTIYPRDFLVLFISSHGTNVKNSFKIIPSDFDLEGDKVLIDFQGDVIEQIDKIECSKLIFIDACHSGTIGAAADPAASPEEQAKEKEKEQERLLDQSKTIVSQSAAADNTSTLASCAANESSWEDNVWGNGAFTKAIIGAFHNEEYKDDAGTFRPTTDDDIITLGELVAYIDRRVPRMIVDAGKNGTQHPFISAAQLAKVKNIRFFKVNK